MKSRLFGEFTGTFILVFAGTGAVVITSLTGAPGHVGIALTFGGVVAALIYTFGHVSGAHFNPAVTLGFWSMGEFKRQDVVPYIAAQCTGAILASLILYLLFIPQIENISEVAYLGATLPRYSAFQSFLFEVILTFILMLVICGSAVHGKAVKEFAGIAIGLTVCLEAMFAGPISGASMNPARSLGPALVSLNAEHLWIYLSATCIGAILAAKTFAHYVRCKNPKECGGEC